MKKFLILIGINLIPILLTFIFLILNLTSHGMKYLYPAGVFSGISFLFLFSSLLYLILWKKKRIMVQFDERQVKSRGDCFSISFFVLVGCLIIDGMIRFHFDIEWSSYFVGTFTWIMVAIGVFAILAIWKDAYTSSEKNRMKFGIFLIVIGILDFGIGLGMGLLDGFIVDKKIAIPFINIFGGVLLCSIATNLFIKIKLDGREVLKDEEFETEVC